MVGAPAAGAAPRARERESVYPVYAETVCLTLKRVLYSYFTTIDRFLPRISAHYTH